MAANTSSIWPKTPGNGYGTVATANTAMDGTGTVVTIATAGSEGAALEDVIAAHLGTNIATVIRFFLNNGSTNATASNNILIGEITMPANTLSQVAASIIQKWFANRKLKPGYKVNATIGTTIAAGVGLSSWFGDF